MSNSALARPTLAFVGAGRAAGALAVALHEAGYAITAIHSLHEANASALAATVGAGAVASAYEAAMRAELTIIAVSDATVSDVAATLATHPDSLRGRGVIHCAGSLDREALSPVRSTGAAIAAVHPLQALSGPGSAGLLRGSLFAIDTDASLAAIIADLVGALGGTPVTIAAADRALYHAAASLAGNAPLPLLAVAVDLLVGVGVDRHAATAGLAHLLGGAAANVERQADTAAALTGPVARGDAATVARHLSALAAADPAALDVYVRAAQAMLDLSGSAADAAVAKVVAAAPLRQRRRRTAA